MSRTDHPGVLICNVRWLELGVVAVTVVRPLRACLLGIAEGLIVVLRQMYYNLGDEKAGEPDVCLSDSNRTHICNIVALE
jgi:hypothetical protein